MTNYRGAPARARRSFRTCPDLDLGIHLSLTDGHPVSDDEEHHPHLLNEDFSFRNNLSLYLRSHFFRSDAVAWIRNELDAQLRRFTDAGLQPHAHLDSPSLSIRYRCCAASFTNWRLKYDVDWVRAHDFRANDLAGTISLLRPTASARTTTPSTCPIM